MEPVVHVDYAIFRLRLAIVDLHILCRVSANFHRRVLTARWC